MCNGTVSQDRKQPSNRHPALSGSDLRRFFSYVTAKWSDSSIGRATNSVSTLGRIAAQCHREDRRTVPNIQLPGATVSSFTSDRCLNVHRHPASVSGSSVAGSNLGAEFQLQRKSEQPPRLPICVTYKTRSTKQHQCSSLGRPPFSPEKIRCTEAARAEQPATDATTYGSSWISS